MNIIEIIIKKREGKALTEKEINYFIDKYLSNDIKDYQASSLLMSICLNGMNEEETFYLTKAMINSGKTLNFNDIDKLIIDKHSTGGVGDKTSLIIVPLLASLGFKVAKMSGRGLGHTGGTIDKLESIPGYKVEMELNKYKKQIKEIGCGIISQSDEIALADKKLYALRDVSGTVESLPLIVSSIMSKKIALGANLICLDVKVGNGAFFKNKKDANKALKSMIDIGHLFSKKMCGVISTMDQPLGYAIGNKIEVIEAIDTLKGKGPKDLEKTCIELAKIIALKSEKYNKKEIESIIKEKLLLEEAYEKFVEMVKAQGGNLENFKIKYKTRIIKANKDGYINKINVYELGKFVSSIGGGRINKEDKIDHDAGIIFRHKIGDKISKGDVLFEVYCNPKIKIDVERLISLVDISLFKTRKVKEIIKVIN